MCVSQTYNFQKFRLDLDLGKTYQQHYTQVEEAPVVSEATWGTEEGVSHLMTASSLKI